MLQVGIKKIASEVRHMELEKLDGKRSIQLIDFSSDSYMIYNYYHWFVMTTTNYIRLVGLYDYLNRNDINYTEINTKKHSKAVKLHCDNYLNEVSPIMNKWRNKVFAHFSITYPHKNDNMGNLIQSVINCVSYKIPYYTIGSFKVGYGDTGTINLDELVLTREYECLLERYWHYYPDDMKIHPISYKYIERFNNY